MCFSVNWQANSQGGKANTAQCASGSTSSSSAGLALVTHAFLAPAPALLLTLQPFFFRNEAGRVKASFVLSTIRAKLCVSLLWDQCTDGCPAHGGTLCSWHCGAGDCRGMLGWGCGSAEGCRRDLVFQIQHSSVPIALLDSVVLCTQVLLKECI